MRARIWRIATWPARLLLGRDFFVSYTRRDATKYAAQLGRCLSTTHRVYLDQLALPAGPGLPARLRRDLSRSTALILVGSPECVASRGMRKELVTFQRTGRLVIIIDVQGTLKKATCRAGPWHRLNGVHCELEDPDAFGSSTPSDEVLAYIRKSFAFLRQELRILYGAAAAVLLLATAAGATWLLTNRAETRATQARALANEAETKRQVAEGQAADAVRRAIDAAEREQDSLRQVTTAQSAARDARKLEASARREAEHQQSLAESRALVAQARFLRGVDSTAIDLYTALATESLARAVTPDAVAIVSASVRLLPKLRKDYSAGRRIFAASPTADGRRLAYITDELALVIVDAATRKELRRVSNLGPTRLYWSVDGERLLAATSPARLIDVTSTRDSFEDRWQHVKAGAFCDKQFVVVLEDERRQLLGVEWERGRQVPLSAPDPLVFAKLSSDCRRVLTHHVTSKLGSFKSGSIESDYVGPAAEGYVRIVDLETGAITARAAIKGAIEGALFEPTKDTVILGNAGGGMTSWTPSTNELRELRPTSPDAVAVPDVEAALAFAPTGGHVALGNSGGGTIVLNTITGETLAMIKQARTVSTVGFSADGSEVYTAGYDGHIRYFQLPALDAVAPWRYDEQTRTLSVSLSPSGDAYAFASAERFAEVRHWSSASVRRRLVHDVPVADVSLSRDARWCITVGLDGRRIHIWDLQRPEEESLVGAITFPIRVMNASISNDGRYLALASDGGEILMASLDDKAMTVVYQAKWDDVGTAMAFDRLSRVLFVGGLRGRGTIFDVVNGQLRNARSFLQETQITSGAFLDKLDNSIVTTGEDGIVRIWSLAPEIKETHRLEVGAPMVAATELGGGTLAVATRTKLGRWMIDPAKLIAESCGRLLGNLPKLLWSRFISGAYDPVCAGVPPLE